MQNLNEIYSVEGSAVLERAKAHAVKYKHSHISPEHLLLGVLETGGPEALKIVKRGKATPEQMKLLVTHHLRTGEHEIPAEQLAFSERAKRVLEAARSECARLQADKIAPQHILFGLSKVPNTVAAAVLGAVDLKGDEIFN